MAGIHTKPNPLLARLSRPANQKTGSSYQGWPIRGNKDSHNAVRALHGRPITGQKVPTREIIQKIQKNKTRPANQKTGMGSWPLLLPPPCYEYAQLDENLTHTLWFIILVSQGGRFIISKKKFNQSIKVVHNLFIYLFCVVNTIRSLMIQF